MTEIALAGLSSHGMFNFVGVLVGLVGLTALIWVKKLPSTALYVSYGIILFLFMLFSWTLYQTNNSQLTLKPDNKPLTLSIPLYSQDFNTDELLWQQARVVDLTTELELTPQWRTNGIGIAGYSLGWFTLKNGDKALVSLTRDDALLLPTTRGYVMLVTLEDNEAAMKAIAAMKH
ncbi:PH domain-containing protein [Shewanella sp. 6_MG-2023]|uniref:PH domain-containing protein n=2 Tax=unclassified Shewanella TaxID=196818 RepID=UPI0026E17EA2|nr:PH domain-containing protein [Shewanella sp. 6_MG-2023]MDO6618509.1 PH domain-containing protein [Shewanella sp. 6_MG-2023]